MSESTTEPAAEPTAPEPTFKPGQLIVHQSLDAQTGLTTPTYGLVVDVVAAHTINEVVNNVVVEVAVAEHAEVVWITGAVLALLPTALLDAAHA